MGLLRLHKGNVRLIRGSYPPETSLDVCPVSVKEFKPIRTLLIPFMWGSSAPNSGCLGLWLIWASR